MQIRLQIPLLVILLGISPGVFAYLDPSTGSMVISVLVGVFASIVLALKTYWYRLKNLFRGKITEPSSDDHTS
jgi:O-antigen/teichoic acid export membrane protein